MSEVTEKIRRFVYEQRCVDFVIPLADFTKEDEPLITAGVFRKSAREAISIPCPFGCGERETISILDYGDGRVERFIVCQNGEGDKVLEPRDYELMEFVPEVYFKNWSRKDLLQEPGKTKKKPMTRSTSFMKYQREIVIEYLEVECHRPASSVTVADCLHVWNLPKYKAEWDRRAKFKDRKRGYLNPRILCKGIRYYLNN